MRLREVLLGKKIPDEEADEEKLGVPSAVPVLGLDALASAAYGPEAALVVLSAAGAAGLRLLGPITAAIVALLLLVQLSYRQTIGAYPDGGGTYSVARANLGRTASLFAAASLLLDYVLNVAVAVSAGVGALVSAVPALEAHVLALCLGLLGVIVVVNLRGLRSAGVVFMLPTLAFVALLFAAIAVGAAKALAAGGDPRPVVPPPHLHGAAAAAGTWLALHAFASGCTAMTGVEAVSNAVPAFREPTRPNARRTLAVIVVILSVLLVGIAWLARVYGVAATETGAPGYQSVLSQLVAATTGRGAFYFATMAAVVAVLCLSANTSFADFPRLCRQLALDEHLPEAFAHAGPRFVFSTGVLVLAALSGALLVVFGGVTDRLIPLFAVGAFSAFTLSQAGMVVHWSRSREAGARWRRAVNLAGAIATGAALLVIGAAKFRRGAWIPIGLVPLVVLLFRRTRAHCEEVRRAAGPDEPLDLEGEQPPVVVVPIRSLDRIARKALRFALSISREVYAVQVVAGERARDDLRSRWRSLVEEPARAAGLPPPHLVVLHSRYREVVHPIVRYARDLANAAGRTVGVVVPELVERRWYHFILQGHTATALKMQLLFLGGPRVVIIDTPWYLRDRPHPPRAARRRAAARSSGEALPAPGAAR